jgi:hypothetical protein
MTNNTNLEVQAVASAAAKEVDPTISDTLLVYFNLVVKAGTPSEELLQSLFDTYLKDHAGSFEGTETSKKFKKAVEVILANLINCHAQDYAALLFPIGSKHLDKNRYQPNYVTRTMIPRAVELLESVGLITKITGTGLFLNTATGMDGNLISKTREATRLILNPDIDLGLCSHLDFESIPESEVVILRGKKLTPSSTADLVDYSDDSELGKAIAEHIRPSVRAINEFTARHPIEYLGDHKVNRSALKYRRVFNEGSIELGGRYFGHHAQYIPSVERINLRIDGHPVIDLDYQNMHLNLALYLAGAEEPCTGDAFTIEGYEQYRKQFKMVAYAMMNTSSPLRTWTKDLQSFQQVWPHKFRDFKAILLKHQPLLAQFDGKEIGRKLMNLESKIITRACINMINMNYGFLILHDGLLVSSQAKYAEGCMHEAYKFFTGWNPVITSIKHF